VDELVDHVRAVEVRGVNVGDPHLHRFAQHSDDAVVVRRRPEDPGAGELHRTEPHPGDCEVPGQGERAARKCAHCH